MNHAGRDRTAQLTEEVEREHLQQVGIGLDAFGWSREVAHRVDRRCSACSIVQRKVFGVAQCAHAKRMTVAKFERFEPGNRGVVQLEPFPLPRHRVDAEQVAECHGVSAGMSNHRDPLIGIVELPDGQFAVDADAAVPCHKSVGTSSDPVGEVPYGLAAFESGPSLERRSGE